MINDIKTITDIIQSTITSISIIFAAGWVYYKYVWQQEKYPNIEFIVDINIIGIKSEYWIIELIAWVENKGKAKHRMNIFEFDLYGIKNDDDLCNKEEIGNQIYFPNSIANGSFMPKNFDYFFIDPGVKSKYSYITKVHKDMNFIIMHSWFNYLDRKNYNHVAEKTIKIPNLQS